MADRQRRDGYPHGGLGAGAHIYAVFRVHETTVLYRGILCECSTGAFCRFRGVLALAGMEC